MRIQFWRVGRQREGWKTRHENRLSPQNTGTGGWGMNALLTRSHQNTWEKWKNFDAEGKLFNPLRKASRIFVLFQVSLLYRSSSLYRRTLIVKKNAPDNKARPWNFWDDVVVVVDVIFRLNNNDAAQNNYVGESIYRKFIVQSVSCTKDPNLLFIVRYMSIHQGRD